MGASLRLAEPAMMTPHLQVFVLCLHSAAAEAIKGRTLTVTSAQHEPWFKLKDDSSNRVGNDRFEGFVMDLLGNLENKTGASFQVSLQADGRYGGLDENTGEWSGMIGSVMAGEADLAVTRASSPSSWRAPGQSTPLLRTAAS